MIKIKIKNSLRLLTIALIIIIFTACENNESKKVLDVNIIPKPLELKINKGNFSLNEDTQIIINSDDQQVQSVVSYFLDQFNIASGFSLEVSDRINATNNYIELTDKIKDPTLGKEGYTLKSDSDKIILTGTPHGLFYAIQTLFQLLPPEIYSRKKVADVKWIVPAVEITDKPRFKWRGMHLDVGRHLFPVSFIKKYIDFLAMHKLNVFHWHLTEDQGWRIEIKKYPRLTEIGAWRSGSQIGKTDKDDGIRYGGYYTQDEIRDIVAYAEKRFITVVPEIELPGHSVAALTAYPQLSCTGGPFHVRTKWGISDDIYCAGNDSVFSFLENVLTEVIELFPSKYIHIGGDEAPKTRWKECPKCQKRIKDEGLKDEHELQSYFISRIEKFLNSKGKQIIGWDEILEGGLAPNAAVMSWRGTEGGVHAARQKHNAVMTPADYLYFCYYQGKPVNEPPALGGFIPIEKVYEYEPVPEELSPEEQKFIIGVQGCLWTEMVDSPEMAEYMLLPRLCALSEIAWSPIEKRNLDDFLERMQAQYARLDQMEVNYRRPEIKGFKNKNIFIDDTQVDLMSQMKGTEIRYTMDGSTPTKNSELYTGPFNLSESAVIKLIEITPKGKVSPVYTAEYIKQQPFKPENVGETQKGLGYQYFVFNEPVRSTTQLFGMKPEATGVVDNFKYPFENEKLPGRFGLIFNGFIDIPHKGIYTFIVNSNDGSTLYVAGQLVVDNDGTHGAYEKMGEIALSPGLHKIQLNYFQDGGGKVLEVKWNKPGSKVEEIPASILYH